jgi:hypothetical protein
MSQKKSENERKTIQRHEGPDSFMILMLLSLLVKSSSSSEVY